MKTLFKWVVITLKISVRDRARRSKTEKVGIVCRMGDIVVKPKLKNDFFSFLLELDAFLKQKT